MFKSDDINEFREYVKNVTPLKKSNSHKSLFKKSSQPSRIPLKVRQQELLETEFEPVAAVSSETILNFARSGIQHKVLKKLRQGQIPPEVILDLHGATVTEAQAALKKFLMNCHHQQLRCVKIIHGKSRGKQQPILKNKVNQWLRSFVIVLAFHSAKANEGGTGVLYVLLKRTKS